MSSTDFFDEDLAKPRDFSASSFASTSSSGGTAASPTSISIQETAGGGNTQASGETEEGGRVVSDLDLARMSKHRDNLEDQATKTLTEIEQLKQRTDDLEVERRQLDDLRRKQDGYVNSKREVMQRLNQSVLAIEKEEVKASQMLDLYGDTRQRFRKMAAEIDAVNEGDWPDATMKDELSKAQDLVDSIRVESSKSLVKLDTFALQEGNSFTRVSDLGEKDAVSTSSERPFSYWLKVGLAISLPLSIFLSVTGVVAYFAVTQWIQ